MTHQPTGGGLYLTLTPGKPQDLVRCRWFGAWLDPDLAKYEHPGGELAGAGHWLIELEVVAVRGQRVLVRIKAPDFVRLMRAGCEGSGPGEDDRAA